MGLAQPPPLTAQVIIKSRWPYCFTTEYFIFGTGRRHISSTLTLADLCCYTRMRNIPENTIFTVGK